ncbi:hypothetical protein DSTSK_28630 [Desulforhabdus sp. TSK]|nr:hypothetical protein DSTSK_28630 [Desulforhabdus sp. TSK]
MESQEERKGSCSAKNTGLELYCYKCGRELPLLHPHIMVERTDEDENLICEWCYEASCTAKKPE